MPQLSRNESGSVQPAHSQCTGCGKTYFVVEELLAPPGAVDEDAAPPGLLLLDAPPLGLEDIEPVPEAEPLMPLPLLLVPPVPPVVLELEELGLLGVVVEDEEDEPPGTTTVSFSLLVVLLVLLDPVPPPPGTTVVVSFRSQAPSARAAKMIIKYPLRFMSTPFSFSVVTTTSAPAC